MHYRLFHITALDLLRRNCQMLKKQPLVDPEAALNHQPGEQCLVIIKALHPAGLRPQLALSSFIMPTSSITSLLTPPPQKTNLLYIPLLDQGRQSKIPAKRKFLEHADTHERTSSHMFPGNRWVSPLFECTLLNIGMAFLVFSSQMSPVSSYCVLIQTKNLRHKVGHRVYTFGTPRWTSKVWRWKIYRRTKRDPFTLDELELDFFQLN